MRAKPKSVTTGKTIRRLSDDQPVDFCAPAFNYCGDSISSENQIESPPSPSMPIDDPRGKKAMNETQSPSSEASALITDLVRLASQLVDKNDLTANESLVIKAANEVVLDLSKNFSRAINSSNKKVVRQSPRKRSSKKSS